MLLRYKEEAEMPLKVSGSSDHDRKLVFFGVQQKIDPQANRTRRSCLIAAFNILFLSAALYLLPAVNDGVPFVEIIYGIPLIVAVGLLSLLAAYYFTTFSDQVDFNSDIGYRTLKDFYSSEVRRFGTDGGYYSEWLHDLISGRLFVSSTDISGIISIPLARVASIVKTESAIVKIKKHSLFPLFSRLVGTDVVELSFKTALEAQEFCSSIQRLTR